MQKYANNSFITMMGKQAMRCRLYFHGLCKAVYVVAYMEGSGECAWLCTITAFINYVFYYPIPNMFTLLYTK